MLSQSVPHVQEDPASEGASVSEVIECRDVELFWNTSNLNKVSFDQKLSKASSGMKYLEREKRLKIPKMINLSWTCLRRSARLANKTKQNMAYLLNS